MALTTPMQGATVIEDWISEGTAVHLTGQPIGRIRIAVLKHNLRTKTQKIGWREFTLVSRSEILNHFGIDTADRSQTSCKGELV